MNTRPSYSHALWSFSPSSRSTTSMFTGTLSTSYVHGVIVCGVFLLDAGDCWRQIFASRGPTVIRWSSRHQRSLFHPWWAIAIRGDDVTNRRRPLSVDPRNRHPLWCRVNAFNRSLQLGDCLVKIVVHDGQIEEMPICLLQHVRLFRQTF